MKPKALLLIALLFTCSVLSSRPNEKDSYEPEYQKPDHVYNWRVVNVLNKPDGDGPTNNPFIVCAIDDGTGPKSPGPQVVVKRGDHLEITVTNDTPFPLTIHWHGFEQTRTMWADGASGITQWDIPSRSSYVYRFQAEVAGTFFYHGHATQSQGDGLLGSFIVKDSKRHNPYHRRYHVDEALLLHSLPERNAVGGMMESSYFMRRLPNFLPDVLAYKEAMINGHTSNNPYIITMKPHETRRLRVINGDYQVEVLFTVEGHSFSVIAVEADYVKEKHYGPGEYAFLSIAQRVDILLTADQAPGNYRFRAIGARNTEYAYGIINYEGVDKTLPPIDPTPLPQPPVPHSNNFTPYFPTTMPKGEWGCQQQVNISAASFVDGPANNGPNISTFPLSWKIAINGGAFHKWEQPDVPTIFDPKRTVINKVNVKLGTVVDLLVFNYDSVPHPYHIHGHHFWELGRGDGPFDPSKLNFENPLRRDVFELDPGPRCTPADAGQGDCITSSQCLFGSVCNKNSPLFGAKSPTWLALRIHFDHEGPFLAHCHINSHMKEGFMSVFVVSKEKDRFQFKIPEYIPRSTFHRIEKRHKYEEEDEEEYDKKK